MIPSRAFTTPPPSSTSTVTPVLPTTDEQSDGLSTGAVVGIIVGSLVGILVLVILIIGIYIWLVTVLYVSIHKQNIYFLCMCGIN